MGSLFRSEDMTLRQLILQPEIAYCCMAELGELGLVQFNDLNPGLTAFQRKYVNEIRRCDEMERRLRFFEKEAKADNIPILDSLEVNPEALLPSEMTQLEIQLNSLESDLKEIITNTTALKTNFLELTQLKHLLRKTQTFFQEAMINPSRLTDDDSSLMQEETWKRTDSNPISFGFLAGVIPKERVGAFEVMLWRACSGNVLLRQADIDVPLKDPVTGEDFHSCVFIVFFNGERLKTRVKKICQGFKATLYPCPESSDDRREMAIGVMTRLEDLNTVLTQTESHRRRLLSSAAKDIRAWFIKVRKIKAIYHTLNMFNLDFTKKCLIGECWCAVRDLDRIQAALLRGKTRGGGTLDPIFTPLSTDQSPPTYFKTNMFTSAFQKIIDSYGVATYKEVNPAPFTIISFPFLFGVMFGDSGHGLILFCFGAWMIWNQKKYLSQKDDEDNEVWSIFFGGRYLIALMGLFSTYAGLLYNDCFSKGINIFGSGWYPNEDRFPDANSFKSSSTFTLDPVTDNSGSSYPLGIDPVWMLALNKIPFLNSFKMKLSVTLGIAQMLFGVILSLFNHVYFKKTINIYSMFLPEIIFLLSVFGYLIGLVFFKWLAYNATDASCAPSLLMHFINMFLLTYPSAPCSALTFYPGQQTIQTLLLLLAVVCIPWLLFLKPFILYRENARKQQTLSIRADDASVSYHNGDSSQYAYTSLEVVDDDDDNGDKDVQIKNPSSMKANNKDGGNEEFRFGEIMILQAIHTIEYCLGCVSHTASYLRLWALSLAHAQLSEVLWSMVIRLAFKTPGLLGAVLAFAVFIPWALLTVAILLLMEGLSAFLHTLRLHWVEFQSKFYKGEGYLFQPYSFKAFMEQKSTED